MLPWGIMENTLQSYSEGDTLLYTVWYLPRTFQTLASEYTLNMNNAEIFFTHRIITKGRYFSRVVGCDVGPILKRIIWQPISVPLQRS